MRHDPILAVFVALASAFALFPSSALPQSYPSKPVKVIAQFGPGTPGDMIVRVVAALLSEPFGQPVVVENRAGAGGVVAAGAVARSAPDGYTLLALTATVPVVQAVLSRKPLPFDPSKDLTPITTLGEIPTLIVAHPSLPANSLKELIDYAKANPGKVSYGTTGVGSPHHLSGEQLKMLTGADMVHVPYKTSPVLDAASGALQLAYVVAAQGMPLVRSGKVKVITVVAENRYRLLPDVPVVSEVVPGFEVPPAWTALFGPGNLPAPVLRRIHADVLKSITSPEGRAKVLDAGFEVVVSKSPEDFAADIKRQVALVSRIVKAAAIPPID